VKLGFNIEPDERIEDFAFELQVTGERATEAKPVIEKIVDKVLARNKRGFETRGATTGRYWAPLKASTVARKAREGRADPFAPLRNTDALMESLSTRRAPHQILKIEDDGFLLQTTLDYAGFHVEGTEKMPARPPMTIAAKHAHEYIGDINDFIFGSDNG
jgi:phage gpG-like protein